MPTPTHHHRTILGIHSNIAGDGHDLTAGHAWISVTRAGTTTFYGLWPDKHPRTVNNGNKTDIRKNLEAGAAGIANRYYLLSPSQSRRLEAEIKKNIEWRYTNTCASWASEVVLEVLKIDIDADDYLGVETPRELGSSILALEKKNPTSRSSPAPIKVKTQSSSSTGS